MHFAIISSNGNVLEWYRDEGAARSALAEILAESPDAADHVDLLGFDDAGNPFRPSAVPVPVRLVWWSIRALHLPATQGGIAAQVTASGFREVPANESNERVPVRVT